MQVGDLGVQGAAGGLRRGERRDLTEVAVLGCEEGPQWRNVQSRRDEQQDERRQPRGRSSTGARRGLRRPAARCCWFAELVLLTTGAARP